MADVTLQVRDVYPPTTSVGLYKLSDWTAGTSPTQGTAPPGSATATVAVAANGTLAFTGLTGGTDYVAGAQVNGVWTYRQFHADSSSGQGVELGYAEVTSAQTTSSTSFSDVTGWAVTVTAGSRPLRVRAWCGTHPTTNAATGGVKYRLVRTDTSATVAEADHDSAAANGPCPLPVIERRVSVAAGTTITFKVQIGARVAGTATFNSTTDAPLAIQVLEV